MTVNAEKAPKKGFSVVKERQAETGRNLDGPCFGRESHLAT